jgi:hypothetical protein
MIAVEHAVVSSIFYELIFLCLFAVDRSIRVLRQRRAQAAEQEGHQTRHQAVGCGLPSSASSICQSVTRRKASVPAMA